MDKAASIFFRFDVQPKDVESFISWMDNPTITRYLNEYSSVSSHMRNALLQIPSPMLTYHFNRNGKFFVVCDKCDNAIGFVKLTKHVNSAYEVVYVIGQEELWVQGFGEKALRKARHTAFFSLNAKSVHAKIYSDNVRSVRMVNSCGFRAKNTATMLNHYEITLDDFLSNLKMQGG